MGPPPAVAAVRRAVRASVADLDAEALVLVACSGGADSMALAVALAFEAPRAGLRAGAVTVDHGLQPGSGHRAAATAADLVALGLDPVAVLPVRVGTAGGPEAAARQARYSALDAAAERLGAAAVLLGHTRDDQAETVLLGLARGSGARSLSGMPPVRGRFRRPLLGLPRETVRAAAAGLRTWDDPHNADPAFARSRVRQDVLPTLEKALGPGVPAALARTADQLRADADALDGWAATAYAEAAAGGPGLDVAVLDTVPPAVRTRVLRRAALDAGCPATDLTADHVGELDRLVTDWHGQGPLHLPGGVRGSRERAMLLLSGPDRSGRTPD
ncbi:MAG TPA: tRNA lysidine(34) synthetase TilS [Actinomycetes bacterium]